MLCFYWQHQLLVTRIGPFFMGCRVHHEPKSWCTEAVHLNPNTILHSDSESYCQGIQDLFACNCLILPFLQAHREPQPTDSQPNLAY